MRGLALAGLLALLLLLPFPLQAQGPAGIEGQVVNGTAGVDPPGGLEVQLEVRRGTGEVQRFTTRTGSEGEFRFPDAPVGPEFRYRLSTDYQGVPYTLEWEGPPPSPLRLQIYEATPSAEALHLPEATVVVVQAEGARRRLAVLSVVQVENRGDRAYRPSVPRSGAEDLLFFPLPPGAEGLEVQTTLPDRGHLLSVGEGFVLLAPVPPGRAEVLFTYQAPYQGRRWVFPFSPVQRVGRLRLLVAEGVGEVRGGPWGPGRLVRVGSTPFHLYETGPVPPGSKVDIILSGLPQPPLGQRVGEVVGSEAVGKGLVVGGTALVLGGFLGYALWRGPSRRREGLLQALARLDDEYARGRVDEEDYRRRRALLKGALLGERTGGGDDAA